MSQIDWSKAPEGATHFTPKIDGSGIWCDVFWRIDGYVATEAWQVRPEGGLDHYSYPTGFDASRAIPRPVVWDGTGLPPVGAACECQYAVEHYEAWHAGECIARGLSPEGEEICVIKSQNTIACYRSGKHIRPIRTPEQIAAEERRSRVTAIERVMRRGQEQAMTITEIAAAIHDAGYRKVEGGEA